MKKGVKILQNVIIKSAVEDTSRDIQEYKDSDLLNQYPDMSSICGLYVETKIPEKELMADPSINICQLQKTDLNLLNEETIKLKISSTVDSFEDISLNKYQDMSSVCSSDVVISKSKIVHVADTNTNTCLIQKSGLNPWNKDDAKLKIPCTLECSEKSFSNKCEDVGSVCSSDVVTDHSKKLYMADASTNICQIKETGSNSLDEETTKLKIASTVQCSENNFCKSSKWKTSVYQRSERNKRAREKSFDENQSRLTDYYSIIGPVSDLVIENIHLISDKQHTVPQTKPQINVLLNKLMDISIKNSHICPNRNSYDVIIVRFAVLVYYMGGRMMYEILHANLRNALPSISTINRFIEKSRTKTEEADFDFDGLLQFLEERNLPKIVCISEDGTRITGKIEYDSKSNKVVGFVLPLNNGLPQRDTFVATSEVAIRSFFENYQKSNYAYVILAQPLAEAPFFCLSLYGTDNRFSHQDVLNRWSFLKYKCQEKGITIAGFSADGDTRLLKAMRINTSLPTQKNVDWPWFQADLSDGEEVYIQDTTHIITKLRTRLLKKGIVLPLGNYEVAAEHLYQLLSQFAKDKHLLTTSDLNAEDKMNFSAAERICSEAVTAHLDNIPGSFGTASYLKMMRFVLASFLDNELSLPSRLYYMWYAVFFLRIWRSWIKQHKSYNTRENFLSDNCYLCIELNAHGLIKLINQMKENKLDPKMFNICNFSSQPCEQLFRAARSMTTTNSTMINFSIQDLLRRIDRIKTINSFLFDLDLARDGIFEFPREQRKKTRYAAHRSVSNEEVRDLNITNIVETALRDVLAQMKTLGVEVRDSDAWEKNGIPLIGTKNTEKEVASHQILISEDDLEKEIDNLYCSSSLVPETNTQVLKSIFDSDESAENCAEKECQDLDTDNNAPSDICLKDYSKLASEVDVNSPYLKISVNNKVKVIKKSSFCWLLDEKNGKVSTDRLRRFFVKNNGNSKKIEKKIRGKKDIASVPDKPARKAKVTKKKEENKEDSNSEDSRDDTFEYDDNTDSESCGNGSDQDAEGELQGHKDDLKTKSNILERNSDVLSDVLAGQFVIVELTTDKSNKKRFVAEVQQTHPNIVCSFLRNGHTAFAYIFPEVPDEAEILHTEIICKLPAPIKMRRGGYLFSKDYLNKYII